MTTFLISYDINKASLEMMMQVLITHHNDRHAVPFDGAFLIKTTDSKEQIITRLYNSGIIALITPVEKSAIDGPLKGNAWESIHRSVF